MVAAKGKMSPCRGVEMQEMWSQQQAEVLSFVAVLPPGELI